VKWQIARGPNFSVCTYVDVINNENLPGLCGCPFATMLDVINNVSLLGLCGCPFGTMHQNSGICDYWSDLVPESTL